MLTKLFFSTFLSVLLLVIDPGDIATVNKYKKNAQEAYENNDYKAAAESYQYLVDSMGVMESEVLLNLAHCYFQTDDQTKASQYYKSLADSKDPQVKSVALQQLGVINANKKDYQKALEDFKDALKANPRNEDARYDYELVKRKLEEEKKKEEEEKKDDKKEDQQKKKEEEEQEKKKEEEQDKEDQQSDQDQESEQKQDQENKNKEEQDEEKKQEEQQEQEKSEEEKKKQQQQQQQLENPEINRARAEQILKSMEEQEKQYFQQLKKKAQKKKETGPDW
ncbi:tetratricopeptide repeat protein [Chondrinema litorale]|uniref:tetratricopeptide repeat protein n=1 Tax=Chondrinema litorale TaxID=2994555 RepID=UPI0025426F05|nr:tetratricopeptide repeat protein [Chondrinema litorale]UZR94257.1 tetratricopeptide repeat protein [Chondrinema litorale]